LIVVQASSLRHRRVDFSNPFALLKKQAGCLHHNRSAVSSYLRLHRFE